MTLWIEEFATCVVKPHRSARRLGTNCTSRASNLRIPFAT